MIHQFTDGERSISVVIPTYNRGSRVAATIDSVLAQTLPPLEILVVDDGSTDGTPDWIEAHYGDKVRMIRQRNGGVARARNRGLEEAHGEFIAFLDHDDLWLPDKLKAQLKAFQTEPDVGVVYCDWEQVDEENQPLASGDDRLMAVKEASASGEIYRSLFESNFIISMSVPLIRRATLEKVGGFDPRMVPSDDWDLWLRLALQTRFVFVNKKLVCYFHHPKQQSGIQIEMWKALSRVVLKHWKAGLRQPRSFWLHVSGKHYYLSIDPYYKQAKTAINQGNWREVRKQFLRCFSKSPAILLTPQWLYIIKRWLTHDTTAF